MTMTMTTATTDGKAGRGHAREIVDMHSGEIVGHAMSLRAALRRCDSLDTAYGAHRYTQRPVAVDLAMGTDDHKNQVDVQIDGRGR
jgi:hypothetical protein